MTGIKGRSGRRCLKKPTKRDAEIIQAVLKGATLAELGRVYGISRQRIHQIRNRWTGYRINGGVYYYNGARTNLKKKEK